MAKTHEISGGCHCGAIRWQMNSPVVPEGMPIWVCGCSFCVKHGVRYSSWSEAELLLRAVDPDQVAHYAFGHGTADFIFCARCGVIIAALMAEAEGTTGVVNLNSADASERFTRPPNHLDFEGESVVERRTRRGKFWIGSVDWADRASVITNP